MGNNDLLFPVIIIIAIVLVIGTIGVTINLAIEENNKYTESVKEEIITIQSISPAPGLSPNSFGQLMVDNAQQLMFYTTDGRGFQNIEDERMNKYETRDLLINLKIGGTYKVKYVGWRDGQLSQYPNILSITEVVDETKAVGFSWNNFLGDWNIKDVALFDIANYDFIDGKMVFIGDTKTVNIDAYKNQTAQNKIISDAEEANQDNQ